MLALIVSIQVKPEMRDRFIAIAEDDSTSSVRDEPGCVRFDVLEDQVDPNHFFFYEVYRDETAHQAHTQTPHYARFRAAIPDLIARPNVRTDCRTLFGQGYT